MRKSFNHPGTKGNASEGVWIDLLEKYLPNCNVGDCDLHVTSVRFSRNSHHWKLLHNPFPAFGSRRSNQSLAR